MCLRTFPERLPRFSSLMFLSGNLSNSWYCFRLILRPHWAVLRVYSWIYSQGSLWLCLEEQTWSGIVPSWSHARQGPFLPDYGSSQTVAILVPEHGLSLPDLWECSTISRCIFSDSGREDPSSTAICGTGGTKQAGELALSFLHTVPTSFSLLVC